MRGDIKWTNLSRRQIAERMGGPGTPVSRDVVSQLLRQHGYRRRKAQKKKTMGRSEYPGAKKILVLCDGGGSNSATRYVFKEELQKLALRLGVEIRVAHYPPYCSKYNPIEHRLFPHVTRACRGVIFRTLETARYYMAKASTQAGLTVTVTMLEKVYETGRKCAEGFKESMTIAFDKVLPKWNYRAIPSKS